MSSYNFLERQLHNIVLSNRWLRESMFEFERSIFLKKDFPIKYNHVFIAGLARSGTTTLLNAIYSSGDFGSLSYSDMPFLMSPNLWSLIYRNKSSKSLERAHQDGIKININSPEAFEEVFWRTFYDKENLGQKFNDYVKLILIQKNKLRYLSKNNQNVRRIDFLIEKLPKSFFLVPFRDPLQHCNSLLIQHKKFCHLAESDKFGSKYIDLIGHSEFGISYKPLIKDNIKHLDYFSLDHWLEQWRLTYENLLKKFANQENVIFICYEDLCDDINTWEKLKNKISLPDSLKYEFIESKKDIKKRFSSNLKNNCYDIYRKLKDQCLKN